jgi:TRAP-type C4-dicarboxylate transport system permease small subunit
MIFYYLKEQLFILILGSLSFGVTYFVALYYGLRNPITISFPFIVGFVVSFVFIGTIMRFMTKK